MSTQPDTSGIDDEDLAEVFTYTLDGTVDPIEACQLVTQALEAAGWTALESFSPSEQSDPGNREYALADISFLMPDGRMIWLQLECPHDGAFAQEAS